MRLYLGPKPELVEKNRRNISAPRGKSWLITRYYDGWVYWECAVGVERGVISPRAEISSRWKSVGVTVVLSSSGKEQEDPLPPGLGSVIDEFGCRVQNWDSVQSKVDYGKKFSTVLCLL